jgi:hypothetical protein
MVSIATPADVGLAQWLRFGYCSYRNPVIARACLEFLVPVGIHCLYMEFDAVSALGTPEEISLLLHQPRFNLSSVPEESLWASTLAQLQPLLLNTAGGQRPGLPAMQASVSEHGVVSFWLEQKSADDLVLRSGLAEIEGNTDLTGLFKLALNAATDYLRVAVQLTAGDGASESARCAMIDGDYELLHRLILEEISKTTLS